MKKHLLFIVIVISLILLISCNKTNPAEPAADNGTATSTPTITITGTITQTPTTTATATNTPVSTATPNLYIDCFINGVNSSISYWFTLRVGGVSYQYATITVNSDTLVYNAGSSVYTQNGATGPYVAGINYNVTIQTQYGTYTGSVMGPGGNEAVTNDVVTYDYDGDGDFVLVRDSGNNIVYNTTDYYADIDTGFTIPGSAYSSGSGDYNVSIYPDSGINNSFTGPTVPGHGYLLIETLKTVSVTKP